MVCYNRVSDTSFGYIYCKLFCIKPYYLTSVDNSHKVTNNELFTIGKAYDCYIEGDEKMIAFIYDENHISNYLILVNIGSFPISSHGNTEPEHIFFGYKDVREHFISLGEYREKQIDDILDESR